MRRRSRRKWCALIVTAGLALAADASASAQSSRATAIETSRAFARLFETPPLAPATTTRTNVMRALAPNDSVVPDRAAGPPRPAGRAVVTRPSTPDRDVLLPALYTGFGVLQALDAHSTVRAVNAGHREANPLIAPFAERPGAMIAVKAATTAGTIYLAHRLAGRNRAAAIALMIAVNGAYAAIVGANYGKGAVEGANGPR